MNMIGLVLGTVGLLTLLLSRDIAVLVVFGFDLLKGKRLESLATEIESGEFYGDMIITNEVSDMRLRYISTVGGSFFFSYYASSNGRTYVVLKFSKAHKMIKKAYQTLS